MILHAVSEFCTPKGTFSIELNIFIIAPTWLWIIWVIFIGWWLALIWFAVSIGLMLTVIGFPIGAYTATKTWHVLTLKTSPQKVVVEAQQQW